MLPFERTFGRSARGFSIRSAEMLPKLVLLLQELGVRTQWAVIGSKRPEFFKLTKQIHNLIHGEGNPKLTDEDHDLYDEVSRANAEELRSHLGPEDILAIHDPQPLGAGTARVNWRRSTGGKDALWYLIWPIAASEQGPG
jgi:hypothetical protein